MGSALTMTFASYILFLSLFIGSSLRKRVRSPNRKGKTMSTAEKRPVILVTSFGTSFESSRSITIGAIVSFLQLSRNFNRRILLERDKISVDGVPQALEKLAAEGVKQVVVMPTHIMEGEEYENKIVKVVKEYEGRFDDIRIGRALLTNTRDLRHLAVILDQATAEFKAPGTARVFMGHGTDHKANEAYAKLQQMITDRGMNDMFIGTVEAAPTLEDMVKIVKDSGFSSAVLSPLMIVAGDHANNDMAGDQEDSWKNVFEKAGIKATCRITGLGSDWRVQRMIAYHCKEAIEK